MHQVQWIIFKRYPHTMCITYPHTLFHGDISSRRPVVIPTLPRIYPQSIHLTFLILKNYSLCMKRRYRRRYVMKSSEKNAYISALSTYPQNLLLRFYIFYFKIKILIVI